MIWVVGIIGFLSGFALGQTLLMRWLAGKSRAELLHNKHLHYTYGLMNWALAIIGCLSAIWLYKYYF